MSPFPRASFLAFTHLVMPWWISSSCPTVHVISTLFLCIPHKSIAVWTRALEIASAVVTASSLATSGFCIRSQSTESGRLSTRCHFLWVIFGFRGIGLWSERGRSFHVRIFIAWWWRRDFRIMIPSSSYHCWFVLLIKSWTIAALMLDTIARGRILGL